MPSEIFHPAVRSWFARHFAAPTPAQAEAWPAIVAGKNVLIAAPTGSGKTLAAFLASIDKLLRQGVAGTLIDETQVVYVSPLKALSNDIQKNLQVPLADIREELARQALPDVEIASWVRTGDTPQAERAKAAKKPPHIVVTTPESLYLLLGSDSGRAMLATTRTVIVDEIHAVAATKRGAHLAISLERLENLCGGKLQRVGLSATQKPIEEVARLLTGRGDAAGPIPECVIVDSGHARARRLAIELTDSPLESVMSNEVWGEVYDRIAALIAEHRTTLIFANTRRTVERVTAELGDRVGDEHVAAHHGSLSKEQRLDAEQRLKGGTLKALVATASLELGIDIGDVDLVCQLSSPRSIASFLQRVGRSGHSVGGTPHGRLFPSSRDDLVECAALLDSVRRGELDKLVIPHRPLDVLAQQIVAEAAASEEWREEDLFRLMRRAWPYRDLERKEFDDVLRMLGDGFTFRRGRRGALIHHDAVNGEIRGRKGAKLTALTSGGTIPDNADYRVQMEPDNIFIGTVNEDFAVESMAGDIFQLGNHSYRILRVERGTLRVEDAQGQPPTIPFWFGEAPGRSDELSVSVSRLRGEIAARLDADKSGASARAWLESEVGLSSVAAEELVAYLAAGHAVFGTLPTQETLVFERFFDEAGGMQFVIHSPYGSRLNRAWGLALRKRFCGKFNFELQAAATEDNIILSLTSVHSFELAEVKAYLHSNMVRKVLIQALLDAPMFLTRWRWAAGIALALPRFRGGKKVPPQLARMDAEDLVANVFPDQLACAENIVGEREVPDHPLVNQTIEDCLQEAMDLAGLETLLRRLESGEIKVVACDLVEPSPLAMEVLSARPYAFLDDAPLEERRTQAVMGRRWMSAEDASDLGRLDGDAIARVRGEAWPAAASADELHDGLVWLGYLTDAEARANPAWPALLDELAKAKRVAQIAAPAGKLWIAAERLPQFRALWPDAALTPEIAVPASYAAEAWTAETAAVEILRGRLEGQGPLTLAMLSESSGLVQDIVRMALSALEGEGFALCGRFTPGASEDEWCERRLLARIHHYTIKRLRAEIEPVPARDFLRFLFSWQRVLPDARMEGPDALDAIVGQLEGFETAAGAWEREILPARIAEYEPAWLDERCLSGRVSWARLRPRVARAEQRASGPVRATPITLMARRHAAYWTALAATDMAAEPSGRSRAVYETLRDHGALFFDELAQATKMLRAQVEEALGELVTLGLVTSDSFGGLRALIAPAAKAPSYGLRRRRRPVVFGMDDAGRWSLARRPVQQDAAFHAEAVEHVARTLLRRYGVVFWRMLEREADWLPPWRELLKVYRRLEARGEIRGGRFVAGFSGEQFALPDAVGKLREIRRQAPDGTFVSLSGADPLNLVGILTPGVKLSALTVNRALYRDGVPVAVLAGGEVKPLEELSPADLWEAQKILLRQGPQDAAKAASFGATPAE